MCIIASLMIFNFVPCYWQDNGAKVDLKGEFLDQAPKKWADYLELVSEFQKKTEACTYDLVNGPREFSQEFVEVKRNPSLDCALICFVMRKEGKVIASMCTGENIKYAFDLKKDESGDKWVLATLALERKGIEYVKLKKSLTGQLSNANCSLHVSNEWLPTWIKEGRFHIDKVACISPDGQGPIKVFFSNSDKAKGKRSYYPAKGWFTVNPKLFWQVTEFEVVEAYVYGLKAMNHSTMEFKENSKGIPLLARKTSLISGREKSGEEIKSKTTYEITIHDDKPGVRAFTLSAFGLPEPQGIEWDKPSRAYLVYLAIGLCLLVVVLLYARKRKKPSAL